MKNARIRALSDPYFPVYEQNRIRIWTDYPIYFNNKVIYFNNDDNIDNKEEENIEWYGLKSPSSPNQMKKLIPFENDLELTRYIKFRNIRNASQEELKEDIKLIKESNKQ